MQAMFGYNFRKDQSFSVYEPCSLDDIELDEEIKPDGYKNRVSQTPKAFTVLVTLWQSENLLCIF